MNIFRLSALSLITMMLIPMGVSAHCKGKHTGDHEHCLTGANEYEANDGVVFLTPSDILGFDYHITGTADRDDIRAGSFRDFIQGFGTRDFIFALGNNDEIHGGDGGDVIDAGEGDDVVYGEAGGDWLAGGAGTGHDILYGGADDDFLQFSLGHDLYHGGLGFDTIQFEDAISVTVDLANATYIANFGLLTEELGIFISIEAASGSPGDDVIYGTPNNDHLFGGEGNDKIYAGDGDDDNLDGGPGDDEIHGGDGNDNLHGDGGRDVMYGEGGDDTIGSRGDGADDEMHGGEGCDTFVFRRNFGVDTIIDFDIVDACDRIDLTAYNPKFSLDLNDMSIDVVDDDIVIDFWLRKQGGNGGTIILKNAASIGVSAIELRIDL